MTSTERIWNEEKETQRLLKVLKIIFLFIIIYFLGIALLILGIYLLKLEQTWAILTLEQWILSAIILISIAICIEIILVLFVLLSKKKQSRVEKQSNLIDGKQVYRYTIPFNAKGGIFSKTYIIIDEEHILNLRYQMVQPADLWEQKQ